MARALRGRKPEEVRAGKPKILVFGPPNVGKTWVALEFPRAYYVDVEGGASRPQYQAKLLRAGGLYLGKDDGSQDFQTVTEEVRTLATTQHPYLTVVIDSFSKLYNLHAAQAELRVGNDYGKDKKEANKPTRQLMLWLERVDMNVVLICHARDKWARHGKELVNEGQTFDGWEKMEYDLDLALHVTGTSESRARVHKTRVEGFPRDEVFPWSYAEVARRAGEATMHRAAAAFAAATPEQVAEVRRLVAVLKVEADWEERCFAKAGVTGWAEMAGPAVAACVARLRGMLAEERTEKVED